ncbi:hypothetical protein HOL34_03105 [bacterium]|jgi:hypothetical protein|nr:hypothetical protein [bacterium]MBT3903282.1 hypothetical protein [bacterium]MBT4577481.1 hypothetical protein [bacterium]MBT5345803.1 hypothetical protein [bacterium]MBT6130856.1 hypothetical protein [bacterium]
MKNHQMWSVVCTLAGAAILADHFKIVHNVWSIALPLLGAFLLFKGVMGLMGKNCCPIK